MALRLFPRLMFGVVNWLAARRGFAADAADEAEHKRTAGIAGETLAYWYLRRLGYTMVGRNVRSAHLRGEIDLIGWDGDVLAFIEVKTRTTETGGPPEDAVDAAKQRALAAMGQSYAARRGLDATPLRFDVLALEAKPGAAPIVRLHKGAFGSG
jgi:putative endonuclease